MPTAATHSMARKSPADSAFSSQRGRRFPPGTPNDGTVAVDETQLPGMAAYAEVDATHTWIMNDERVVGLVVRFLRDGVF